MENLDRDCPVVDKLPQTPLEVIGVINDLAEVAISQPAFWQTQTDYNLDLDPDIEIRVVETPFSTTLYAMDDIQIPLIESRTGNIGVIGIDLPDNPTIPYPTPGLLSLIPSSYSPYEVRGISPGGLPHDEEYFLFSAENNKVYINVVDSNKKGINMNIPFQYNESVVIDN